MKFSTVSFLLLAGCSTGIPHEIRDSVDVEDTFGPHVGELREYEKRSLDIETDSVNFVSLEARDDVDQDEDEFEFDSDSSLEDRAIEPEDMDQKSPGQVIDHKADPEHAHLKPRAKGQEYKLDQLTNQHYKKPHAEIALIQAFNKYHKPLPKKLRKIAQFESDKINNKLGLKGTAAATPPQYYDSQYVVSVQIGTPAQTTYLNFDTGSSDLWVFSTDTYEPDQEGHILYKPDKSNTSKRLPGQTWSIKYGDGSGANGIVYTDKVQVGKTYVKKQAVESATEVSDDIASDKFSHGIMGLAMSSLNTVRPTPQKTYFQNVQDSLATPVFTANLKKGSAGNYNFGYINQDEYYGAVGFAKVKKDSPWWEINVEGFRVAQGAPWHKYNYTAIVDTGTTLLLLPDYLVKFYYKKVKGAYIHKDYDVWVFPCEAKLPSFYFGFGSYRGKVPGNYMNYGRLTTSLCYGGIQSSEGIGFAILGDILLKSQFVVFDLKGQRVGFANKNTVKS
ncbi:hypothetical protein FHETE_7459 [Fusarium heterosporum]|uniref:Peptidase A1 domain-containing protein n=1 Tax=Fusarium heterosporum TaxID=42747 RepID=A0A8H5WI27_FUSHE|nr:hypothetical protein FHETE_7459 [Fusarium heterosporum]